MAGTCGMVDMEMAHPHSSSKESLLLSFRKTNPNCQCLQGFPQLQTATLPKIKSSQGQAHPMTAEAESLDIKVWPFWPTILDISLVQSFMWSHLKLLGQHHNLPPPFVQSCFLLSLSRGLVPGTPPFKHVQHVKPFEAKDAGFGERSTTEDQNLQIQFLGLVSEFTKLSDQ